MTGRFEVYEDRDRKWRFRLKASNGQIVAVGEAYETRAAAKKGCESVQRAAEGEPIVVVDETSGEDQTSKPAPAATSPTRWLVYKHPAEKPVVVLAHGWERTLDGALLRFYTGDRADGSERVVAAFNAASVFGFVCDTDTNTAKAAPDSRLLAFPGEAT